MTHDGFPKQAIMSLVPFTAKGQFIEEMTGALSYTFIDPGDFLQVASLHTPIAVFLHRDFGGSERGLNFLSKVLSFYPETPVLVLTPNGDYNCLFRALSLGAADVLFTPLVKDEVVARLHRRIADEVAPLYRTLCIMVNHLRRCTWDGRRSGTAIHWNSRRRR